MCQVKFEASGAEHEAVNYTFLDWFFYEWPRVVKEVERFFDLFSAEDRRRLLKKDWTMKMKKALLTWATGKLSDAPSRLTNVQVLIAAMIFGEGNWEDPLPVPPVEDPENIKECFDSSKYTPQQCLGAFRLILAYTRGLSSKRRAVSALSTRTQSSSGNSRTSRKTTLEMRTISTIGMSSLLRIIFAATWAGSFSSSLRSCPSLS